MLKQTVATIPVLIVSVINVHVTGLTLMHATSPIAGGDGLIVRAPNGASLQVRDHSGCVGLLELARLCPRLYGVCAMWRMCRR